MAIYHYVCDKEPETRCKLSNLPEEFFDGKDIGISVNLEHRLIQYTPDDQIDADNSPIVLVVSHGMFEEVSIKCPGCEGNARKIIGDVASYVRGNCYLNKEDCTRQMNIHKLQTDDPYGYMRPAGEKDELIKKLRRGKKAPPKNFYPGGTGGLRPSS